MGSGSSMKFKSFYYTVVSLILFSASSVAAQMTLEDLDEGIYARVAGEEIDLVEYKETLGSAVKRKFYHGSIPEGKMQEVQREVGKQLITRELLIQEARRLKLQPDEAWMKETKDRLLENYEKQYGKSEKWPEYRKNLLPKLDRYLEEESLLTALKERLDTVPTPSEKQVRQYYQDNKEKFTSPEQYRVSIILLKVAPSSPVVAWEEAQEEAQHLYEKLQNNADFAELAKLHSADSSAEQGGDMGYLHKGMLAPEIQEKLGKMKPGELSKPIKLLEGVAIFRLQEIRPAVLNPFEKVRQRATALLIRDLQEKARKQLIARLWEEQDVVINKKYYGSDEGKTEGDVGGEAEGKSSGV